MVIFKHAVVFLITRYHYKNQLSKYYTDRTMLHIDVIASYDYRSVDTLGHSLTHQPFLQLH